MNRYTIRKIFVWPVFKFAAVIGAVLAIIPGIVAGLLTRAVVGSLRNLLQGLGLLATGNPDVGGLLEWLTKVDQQGVLTVLWVALGFIVIGGLTYGIAAALGAVIYNLVASISGGLVVSAGALDAPAPAGVPVAQPTPALPQPAPAIPVSPPVQSQPVPAAPPVQSAVQVASPIEQRYPVTQPPRPVAGPWLASTQVAGQRLPLRGERTRLGSAPDNDIVLPGLAPHHAEIRLDNGIFVLYDLAAGQTWVNGRPVAGRNMLKEGFQVRLATQDLTFHVS